MEELILYAVRNKEGKWFRARGFGGHGEPWVDNISKARIYGTPGPARAQVTYFTNNHSKYGVPELVKLHVGLVEVMDEEERVKKANEKKERYLANSEVRHQRWKLQKAKADLEKAQTNLNNLTKDQGDL